ncbi:uncharacterized protein LOC122078751 [Macadamia integrifolia]|uniref:uncharacterized protein LOC122078751 n=1 Tax=Macadamia integrifolia TaxID=60698 RepID=UPI001C4F32F7|nr:uncharacterized protein LOC122078751 [Macadamia integrifolia]
MLTLLSGNLIYMARIHDDGNSTKDGWIQVLSYGCGRLGRSVAEVYSDTMCPGMVESVLKQGWISAAIVKLCLWDIWMLMDISSLNLTICLCIPIELFCNI